MLETLVLNAAPSGIHKLSQVLGSLFTNYFLCIWQVVDTIFFQKVVWINMIHWVKIINPQPVKDPLKVPHHDPLLIPSSPAQSKRGEAYNQLPLQVQTLVLQGPYTNLNLSTKFLP